LIVNELVSNALKHAFPEDRSGRVQVELRLVEHTRYVLTVTDNGVGLPFDFDPENSDTLGLQLVHDLTRQLRGTISARRENGTGFTITFSAGDDPEA
jgi:two-component sensor histidine kinase